MQMREYQVMKPFWFSGILQEVGARLQLTDAQVKYMGDEIALIEPAPEAEREPKRRRAPRDEAATE